MPKFKPLGDDHAIETVAIELTLKEPMADELLYAVDGQYRSELKKILPAREQLYSVEMRMKDGRPSVRETPKKAFEYAYIAPDGAPIRVLRLEENTIRIERHDYSRWKQIKQWATGLLTPVLGVVLEKNSVTRVGVHYTDVFLNSPASPEDPAVLFREDTDLIPERVFHRSKAWHAHAGYIDDSEREEFDHVLERFQVNSTTGKEARVTISASHIAMADEGIQGLLIENESTLLNEILEELHQRNKCLLRDMLSDWAQVAINLDSKGAAA